MLMHPSTVRFAGMGLGWICCCAVLAQETPSSSPTGTNRTVAALQKTQQEFAKHAQAEKTMQDKYRELETQLQKTEADLQNINAQGMQQQLAAMQASMQSMQLSANLQMLAGSGTGGTAADNAMRDFAQTQLLQNRFLSNLDATLRANELMQLDVKSQAVVRKRIETIQAAVRLQQQWMEWQNEQALFFTRYWPNSDPEERLSRSEIEAALDVLDKRDDKDIGAKLVAAQLLSRRERHAEALELVNELLKQETPLQGIAMMTKSKILKALGKDRESKQALQAAIKLDKSNPYLRWVRAEIALADDQVPIAETEWRFLTTIKPMEIQARRALALVLAKRSKKAPGEGLKAIKEATSAMELESVPDWYSHYVMAIAYAAGRKNAQALESIDRAESMAEQEDLKERCRTAKKEIESLGP